MAYVKPANAQRNGSRGGYQKSNQGGRPAAGSSGNAPTHNLAVRSGSGDDVQFIDVSGLWAGETKDGRQLLKGKPRDVELIIRTPEGEFVAEQFIITARN